MGTVPIWQIALGWGLLVAAAAGMIWVAARVFRAGMLIYGQPLSLKAAWAALRGWAMKTIWLVMKHDAGVILRQPSFWIVAVLAPILLVAVQAMATFQGSEASQAGKAEAQAPEPSGLPAIGLVDPAGLLARFPPSFGSDWFVRFADEATARTALETGIVEQVLTIPEDYLTSGQVLVYDKDFQILGSASMGVAFSSGTAWVLDYHADADVRADADREP